MTNRNTQDIIKYFRSFLQKQRNRVRWVIMDMSNLFRKVVQAVFPNAVIICDRFHIVRMVL
ncbi:transposase [Megasphaera stantonii]|nr:transposase [Megasphaera stantonii]